MPRPTLSAAPTRRPSDAPRTDTYTPAVFPADRRSGEPPEYGPADFPGCESFHLPASRIEGYEAAPRPVRR